MQDPGQLDGSEEQHEPIPPQDLMSFLADFRAGLATPAGKTEPAGKTGRASPTPPAGSPAADHATAVQTESQDLTDTYQYSDYEDADPAPSGRSFDDIPWTTPAATTGVATWETAPPSGDWRPDRTRRAPPPVWIILSGALMAVALLAGGLFALRSGPSLSGLSPAKILQKSTAAALKARTVHGVADNSQGNDSTRVVMDMSPSGGVETMSFDGMTAKAIGIGNSLYFRADAGSMSQLFGIGDAEASRLANQWLVMPPDDTDIQQMAQQLQTPVLVKNLLTLSAPITRIASSRHGEVALQGKVPDNGSIRDLGQETPQP